MTNPDLTAKYEEERLRVQEQSQLVYLQGQIDELRRQLKDQTNKYNWAMEQVRKTEASVAQVQNLFERHTGEVAQVQDAMRRDVQVLRKEVTSALVKIDESVRPLRDMQAQIKQVAEARKADRDYVTTWLNRIEQVEQQITVLFAQLKDLDERQRQGMLQLDRLREADQFAVNEVRRASDELQVEKHSLRRQIVESQQLVTDLRSALDDHDARITRIDEIREHINLFSEMLPNQIAEVGGKLPELAAEIKRVARVSTERFLMNQERVEEIRQQSDEKISDLKAADDQQLRQITSWLERIDGYLRELEQRIGRLNVSVGDLQQSHGGRIIGLERRELEQFNTMLGVIQELAERTRIAQIDTRGEAE